MSSASGAGPNDPSTLQTTGTHDMAHGTAHRDGGIDPASPRAQQSTTGARAAASGQRADELDHGHDETPQPLDPSLIAGGENLVGAANHVATGIDSVDANFADEDDAPDRVDHQGLGQDDESRNVR